MTKCIKNIQDLCPDEMNANRGTERGHAMIEDSLRQLGAGRSILVDKHGKVIAGNKTLESAANIGLDDIAVVQTDGKKLVVVQRTDLDLEKGGKARKLAIADNRTGQVSLDWDPNILAQLQEEDAKILEGLFRDDELERLLGEAVEDPMAEWKGMPEFNSEDKTGFASVVIHFANEEDMAAFASLVRQTITEKTKSLWYPKQVIHDGAVSSNNEF